MSHVLKWFYNSDGWPRNQGGGRFVCPICASRVQTELLIEVLKEAGVLEERYLSKYCFSQSVADSETKDHVFESGTAMLIWVVVPI